jgi:hypothetical protein
MVGGIPVSAAMPGNVEDDIESARTVAAAATPKDVFLILSASGTNPFALAIATAVKAARSKVIGMANNAETHLLDLADIHICLATGPEIIAARCWNRPKGSAEHHVVPDGCPAWSCLQRPHGESDCGQRKAGHSCDSDRGKNIRRATVRRGGSTYDGRGPCEAGNPSDEWC